MEKMRNRMPVFIKLLGLASLFLLASCTALLNIPGTGGLVSGTPVSSTPTTGVTESVVTALPATSQPLGTNTPMAQPTLAVGTPPATQAVVDATASGQDLSVTLADDGKTVNLKVGQRFLLNLGEGYDWAPTVTDQNVVSRVVGILVIRGAQGIYKAHAPGTVTLTASGDPTCRQSKPACAMPSRLFKVNLVVGQ
jgi:hypothetical protein